jgi:DNA-binding LytR/AlgR family response regulator
MITCLAVDDEKLALELLEDNIRQVPFLQLVKGCSNVFEAMETMHETKIDLIFLDIQMPGIGGIQFIKSLESQHKPMIIFVTAYHEFAIEGYELSVLDYLLKPVAMDRFLKAANKAKEFMESRKDQPVFPNEFIFVQSEYNLVKVDLHTISHIEGLKDYIKIHVEDATRPIITRMSMKSMEEQLPPSSFMRIHRSFIIHVNKIISIRKGRVKLSKAEVPVGDNYHDAFMEKIGHRKISL